MSPSSHRRDRKQEQFLIVAIATISASRVDGRASPFSNFLPTNAADVARPVSSE